MATISHLYEVWDVKTFFSLLRFCDDWFPLFARVFGRKGTECYDVWNASGTGWGRG